jgi:autotransporter-associated beta strand protein
MHSSLHPRYRSVRILATALAVLITSHAGAAVITWDGGGANTRWSTNANWTNSAPSSSDTNDIVFGSVALQSPSNTTANNTVNNFKVNSITFESTANASFTLTGSTIELAKDGSTQPAIIQNSSLSQIISADLKNSGDSYSFGGNGTGLLTISGNIESGSKNLTKTGSSSVLFTGSLDGGNVILNGGTLAVSANASNLASRNIQFTGGVLATSGNFNRSLGSGGSSVRWAANSDGGFAAYGNALSVNLGGSGSELRWDASNFVDDGAALVLGSAIADNVVTFVNTISLGSSTSATREFRVVDNLNSTSDYARITGQVTESGQPKSLRKTGSGILELAHVNNNYTGSTSVEAGTLRISGALTGSGLVSVLTGSTLAGNGSIAGATTLSAGSFLSPGNATGSVGSAMAFGNSLDLSAINGSAGLIFDLASTDKSDKVTVGGNLNVGTLDFADFAFNALDGFGAGSYTLFDAASVTGSVGSASGTIAGLNARLRINNDDVLLIVSGGQYLKLSSDKEPTLASDIAFNPDALDKQGEILPSLIRDLVKLTGSSQAAGAVRITELTGLPLTLLLDIDLGKSGLTLEQLAAALNDTASLGDDSDSDGDTFTVTAIDVDSLLGKQGFDIALSVNEARSLVGDVTFNWDLTNLNAALNRFAVIPTPESFVAGLMLLGLVMLSRRRLNNQ